MNTLPNGWIEGRVKDLIKSLDAGVSVNSDGDEDSSFKILKTSCVSDGKFIESEVKSVTDEKEIVRLKEYVKGNSIIISRMNTPTLVGENGYIEHENKNLFLPDRLWQAKPKNQSFNMRWLGYWFTSENTRYKLRAMATGTSGSMKNITKSDVMDIKLFIPPLPEQTKIAEILSTWDKAIQTTEQLLANSQQQKKALMQQLLTGKKRLKGFSGEWEEKKIYEIGMVITGMTPSKSEQENYGDDICWATAEDFSNKYIHTTAVKLSILGSKKARILPEGAVLVTCIASIGKNAIAKVRMTTNQQINAIVVNNENFNEFVYYLIEFNRKKLLSLAGITAVPIINKTTFEKIGFLVPTLKEQQKIAQILSTQDHEIDTLQKKLACLKQEKKALVQKLLSGKVRVN